MSLSTRLKRIFATAFTSLMLGYSFSAMLLGAVWVTAQPLLLLLGCLGAMIVFSVMSLNRSTLIITGGLLVVAVAVLLLSDFDLYARLKSIVIEVCNRLMGAKQTLISSGVLCVAVAVVCGVIAYVFTRMPGGVYPATLLFVFLLLLRWLTEGTTELLYILPGMAALVILYSKAYSENTAFHKMLIVALLCVGLAFFAAPKNNYVYPPLQNAADTVRKLFNDYFRFSDPRTVYSVSADGYQPLTEQLGGIATPRQEDVMVVTTDSDVLLRGAISRTYTGLNWTDDNVKSRYLFVDPTRLYKRVELFDADETRLNEISEMKQVSVRFLDEGTSTLFVPQRMINLEAPMDFVLYYNECGEVFTTRDVQDGDNYTLTYYKLPTDMERLVRTVNMSYDPDDPDYSTIYGECTLLPACVENQLYWLTMDIIEGCPTPIQKALAIENWLSQNVTYTLEGNYPPAGRDFVSWFVMDERKGYCTYLASAMTVMARLAQIPARYVEGYSVKADASGETVVTGMSAHAWSELYFAGVGWIPFNVSVVNTLSDIESSGTEGSHTDNSTPEPTPTPEPTEEPDPASNPHPDQTPKPQTDLPDDVADEPTVQPDTTPEPESDSEPPQEHSSVWKLLLFIFGILVLLLVVAVFIVYRLRITDSSFIAAGEKDLSLKVMVWYRTALTLLAVNALYVEGGETMQAFSQRAISSGYADDSFAKFSEAVTDMQYAGKSASSQTVKLGRSACRDIRKHLTNRQKLAYTMKRLRSSIGNYKQIP